MSKSIVKNTVSKFILSIFNIVVPFLVGPYINRLLDKNVFSIYNSGISVIAIFMVFASYGIYNYGVREISKVRDDKKAMSSLFTNLFMFGIVTNIVVSIIYLLYVFFIVETASQPIYFVLIIQLLANAFMVEWINEAVENYEFITKKTIIIRIISTILLFVIITKPQHTLYYTLLMSLTIAANNLASFLYVKKHIKFDFSNLTLAKYIKPLSLLLIISNAGILYSSFDKVMIIHYIGGVSISYYNLPSNLINMIVVVMASLITVSLPRLNYYVSNGKTDEYIDLLDKSSRGYLILLFPSCIGLFCLGYEAMYLYGGKKYIDSSMVLQLFALRFILISFYTILSNQVMYVFKKEKQLVRMLLTGGILNVVLKYILLFLGILSPETAVITMTIAELLLVIMMYRYIKKELKLEINFLSTRYLKYLYASLPFIPIIYLIKFFNLGVFWTIFISVPVCSLLYVGILFAIKDDTVIAILNRVKLKISTRRKD